MKKVLMVLMAIFLFVGCIKDKSNTSVDKIDDMHTSSSDKYSLKIEILDYINSSTLVFVDGKQVAKTLKDSWFAYAEYYDIIYVSKGKHEFKWVTTNTETTKDPFTEKEIYTSFKVERSENFDISKDKKIFKFNSGNQMSECIIKENESPKMPNSYEFYAKLSKRYTLINDMTNPETLINPTTTTSLDNYYNYTFNTGAEGVFRLLITNTEKNASFITNFDLYSKQVNVYDKNNILYQIEYQ